MICAPFGEIDTADLAFKLGSYDSCCGDRIRKRMTKGLMPAYLFGYLTGYEGESALAEIALRMGQDPIRVLDAAETFVSDALKDPEQAESLLQLEKLRKDWLGISE